MLVKNMLYQAVLHVSTSIFCVNYFNNFRQHFVCSAIFPCHRE